ncbi:MAG: class I SAM-dependent methyltransferase [Pseudomonadota bacterium]
MTDQHDADGWAGARGALWARYAGRLDAMMAPVNHPLVDALAPEASDKIADIGCGGGSTTAAILLNGPEETRISGFDVSPDLITKARAHWAEISAEHPDLAPGRAVFHLADAAHAKPDDGPFDRLVSRFGVMFFEDEARAFSNLHAWLKPEGRFAFAVWASPKENPWMSTVRDAVAEHIDLPAPDPEAPGPFRYADGIRFKAHLEACGFSGVEIRPWRGNLALGGGLSSADAADFALGAFAIANPLREQSAAVQKAVRSGLETRFGQNLDASGHVAMAAHVQIVTGHRQ